MSGTPSVVLLELNQFPGAALPTRSQMNNHTQLHGYIENRRQFEVQVQQRSVAGFVLLTM